MTKAETIFNKLAAATPGMASKAWNVLKGTKGKGLAETYAKGEASIAKSTKSIKGVKANAKKNIKAKAPVKEHGAAYNKHKANIKSTKVTNKQVGKDMAAANATTFKARAGVAGVAGIGGIAAMSGGDNEQR